MNVSDLHTVDMKKAGGSDGLDHVTSRADPPATASVEVRPLPIASDTATHVSVPEQSYTDEGLTYFEELIFAHADTDVPSVITYFLFVWLHPLSLATCAATLSGGLVSGNLPALAAALGLELTILSSLPLSKSVRSAILDRAEAVKRAAELKERERSILQMHPLHRRELERLEFLVTCIQESARSQGSATTTLLEASVDFDRLLDGYIRLGVAYAARADLQRRISRAAIEEELHRLQMALEDNTHDLPRQLLARRERVLRHRLTHYDRTETTIRSIRHQLETISDLLDLLYAQSVSPVNAEVRKGDLDRALLEIDEMKDVLTEVEDLDGAPLEESSDDAPRWSESA